MDKFIRSFLTQEAIKEKRLSPNGIYRHMNHYKICYAHLDGDLYSSILESLKGVYPRLSPGAICVIDDYDFEQLPGVNQAVSEFMVDKPERVESMYIGCQHTTIQGFFIKS